MKCRGDDEHAGSGPDAVLWREQRSTAVAQVRALMADYGLSAADVAGRPLAQGTKENPRHRGPASGRRGGGRGLDLR
jgi:hypothetical protein